tara:strand:- start:64 stop:465 length:402 start_codon:yes stop_codon:yes gene_type:complete
MKKLIYLFLTILIVACSGDENDNNNPPDLVGTWKGDTFDADDAPNGEPVSSLWLRLTENGAGVWNETSYITGINQIYAVNWTASNTVATLRLFVDGKSVDIVIVNYEIDKSGESWVVNITDSEGDIFSLTNID